MVWRKQIMNIVLMLAKVKDFDCVIAWLRLPR
jgi:hypothetical protein